MSDTEDTEEIIINKSISFNKGHIIIESFSQKEEEIITSTIEIISDLLVKICEENKIKKCNKNFLLKSFTCENIPSISIKDYLLRLSKHAKVNESTIILILIYIDRLCHMNHFILTYYNIHKLILSAFILAIKYNEEIYYSMIYYSKIGGVSMIELNNLEFEFFILIKFKLFVQTTLFEKYYNDLMSLKDDSDDDDDDEEEYEEYEEDYEEQEEEEDEDEDEKDENEEEEKKQYIDNNNNNISKVNYKKETYDNNVNNINYERECIRI